MNITMLYLSYCITSSSASKNAKIKGAKIKGFTVYKNVPCLQKLLVQVKWIKALPTIYTSYIYTNLLEWPQSIFEQTSYDCNYIALSKVEGTSAWLTFKTNSYSSQTKADMTHQSTRRPSSSP